MRFAIRSVIVAAIVVGLATVARGQISPAAQPSFALSDLATRYENGATLSPSERASLADYASNGVLLGALELEGVRWLSEAGPAEIDRRRLTLAAIVLDGEIAARDEQQPASPALIEWICTELRKNPKPLAAERAWFEATVDLLERGRSQDLAAHLNHAEQRFKNDPWVLMARALSLVRLVPIAPAVLGGDLAGPHTAATPVSTPPTMPGYEGLTVNQQFDRGISPFERGFGASYTIEEGRPSPPSVPSLAMIPSVGPSPVFSPMEFVLSK